jgi:hypothetical protein
MPISRSGRSGVLERFQARDLGRDLRRVEPDAALEHPGLHVVGEHEAVRVALAQLAHAEPVARAGAQQQVHQPLRGHAQAQRPLQAQAARDDAERARELLDHLPFGARLAGRLEHRVGGLD